MNTDDFWSYIERQRDTRSPVESADLIVEMLNDMDDEDQQASALAFMLGQQTDFGQEIGIGTRKCRKAAGQAFDVSEWRKGQKIDIERDLGDLSLALKHVDRPNTLNQPERITIADLHGEVYELAEYSGDAQVSQLAELFSKLKDPHVVAFAVLGPKKDVSLSMSWKTCIDAFLKMDFGHTKRELKKAYGVHPRAGSLWIDLQHDDVRTEIWPYDRIAPALASSTEPPEEGWNYQWKYDGFRAIVHVSDDGPCVYTRGQIERTDSIPELHDQPWPDECIIDCEIVAYDGDDVLDFTDVLKRSNRTEDVEQTAEEIEVKFKAFDMLYHDGDSLIDEPYSDRLDLLRLELPDRMIADHGDTLAETMSDALAAGHEGVIAKAPNSIYHFERDRSWRKLKEDRETVDVIVKECIEATGDTRQKLGPSLGSVRVQTRDGVELGKVGTGFDEDERVEYWRQSIRGEVIEVSAFELQESDGEFGLRFPAFERLRTDAEADTIERVKDIHE